MQTHVRVGAIPASEGLTYAKLWCQFTDLTGPVCREQYLAIVEPFIGTVSPVRLAEGDLHTLSVVYAYASVSANSAKGVRHSVSGSGRSAYYTRNLKFITTMMCHWLVPVHWQRCFPDVLLCSGTTWRPQGMKLERYKTAYKAYRTAVAGVVFGHYNIPHVPGAMFESKEVKTPGASSGGVLTASASGSVAPTASKKASGVQVASANLPVSGAQLQVEAAVNHDPQALHAGASNGDISGITTSTKDLAVQKNLKIAGMLSQLGPVSEIHISTTSVDLSALKRTKVSLRNEAVKAQEVIDADEECARATGAPERLGELLYLYALL